jgi:hypothetical protein
MSHYCNVSCLLYTKVGYVQFVLSVFVSQPPIYTLQFCAIIEGKKISLEGTHRMHTASP